MALVRTTLSAALAADSDRIVLASISALAVGSIVQVGEEKMRVTEVATAATLPSKVFRGIDGTRRLAHSASAGAVFGAPGDFLNVESRFDRRRQVRQYSAAGAIELPAPGCDMVAVINGTGALAMTVAAPSKEQDGDLLIVIADGKAAHTLTYTAGFGDGGSGYDVLTYAAGARNASLFIAVNEQWVLLPSLIAGTATAVSQTIA